MRRLAAALLLACLPLAADDDPRSRVLLDSDCRTETSHQRLTLFANGTVRLFDGSGATRTMRLVELGDSELTAFVARLAEIRFDDLAPGSSGLEGDWVEACEVELTLPESETRRFEYGRFDTISLGLKHVLLILEDLRKSFDDVRQTEARSRGYAPRIGDVVVRRRDGARFEVLSFTLEGNGVELQGLEQPITVYVAKDRILEEYDPPDDGGRP